MIMTYQSKLLHRFHLFNTQHVSSSIITDWRNDGVLLGPGLSLRKRAPAICRYSPLTINNQQSIL